MIGAFEKCSLVIGAFEQRRARKMQLKMSWRRSTAHCKVKVANVHCNINNNNYNCESENTSESVPKQVPEIVLFLTSASKDSVYSSAA